MLIRKWSIKAVIMIMFFVLLGRVDSAVCDETSPQVFMTVTNRAQVDLNPKFFKGLKELGVTDVVYNAAMEDGGLLEHPSEVPHAVVHPGIKKDYIAQWCREAEKHGINVWLQWGRGPRAKGSDTALGRKIIENYQPFFARDKDGKWHRNSLADLNSKPLLKFLHDIIDEYAERYGKYKSFQGIWWDEISIPLYQDNFGDDVGKFSKFCQEKFGESYSGEDMPETNPEDKWWRRHALFRIHIQDAFLQDVNDYAQKRGLKQMGRIDFTQVQANESWRYGTDPNHRAVYYNPVWCTGTSKSYFELFMNYRNVQYDVGPGYGNIAERYASAFNGKDIAFFQYENYAKRYKPRVTEKEFEVYYGLKNARRWIHLIKSWSPGVSPARIAMVVNNTTFILQHPAPGIEYRSTTASILNELSKYYDLDAFEISQTKNLKNYDLIIVPEGCPVSLPKKVFKEYLDYVNHGGNILSLNAFWSTGREDLTQQKDVSKDILGVEKLAKVSIFNKSTLEIKQGTEAYGKILPIKAQIPKKTYGVKTVGAEILGLNQEADTSALCEYRIGKGKVISSWIQSPRHIADGEDQFTQYLAQVISLLIEPPIKAWGNIQIKQTVKKKNRVAISLWNKGKTILRVDPEKLGLPTRIEVKDIITGEVMKPGSGKKYWTKRELKKGIPVVIPCRNAFKVLAFGAPDSLKEFQGIMAATDFAYVTTTVALRENIQIPEEKSKKHRKPGVYVAIFKAGYGSEGICEALKDIKGMNVEYIQNLMLETLKKYQAVILPQMKEGILLSTNPAWKKDIKQYVQEGGGLLVTHNAIGYRKMPSLFPEICIGGIGNPRSTECVVVKKHPVTKDISLNKPFTHAYYDHIELEVGIQGTVLVREVDYYRKAPIVIVGKIGQGRYIANGMITGYYSRKGEKPLEGEEAPVGDELKILINSMEWLCKVGDESQKNNNSSSGTDRKVIVALTPNKGYHDGCWLASIKKLGYEGEFLKPIDFYSVDKLLKYPVLILSITSTFDKPAYETIIEYVKRGGILIIDGKACRRKPIAEVSQCKDAGRIYIDKIKFIGNHPITKGLPEQMTLLDVPENPLYHWGEDLMPLNKSCQVLAMADAYVFAKKESGGYEKGTSLGERNIITLTKIDKGYCVYLGVMTPKIVRDTKNEIVPLLLKNIIEWAWAENTNSLVTKSNERN